MLMINVSEKAGKGGTLLTGLSRDRERCSCRLRPTLSGAASLREVRNGNDCRPEPGGWGSTARLCRGTATPSLSLPLLVYP